MFFHSLERMKVKVVVILLLSWISSVSVIKCTARQMETYAVEGDAVRLYCGADLEDLESTFSFTFTWTKDNNPLKTGPRLKLQGSSLWFLKTVSSDSGHYMCTRTNASVSTNSTVFLSIEKGQCPSAMELKPALEGASLDLTCTEEPIATLGQILQVQWMKDCKSTGIQDSKINLQVSMSSTGNYTCMVIFSHEGQNYTASYTLQLEVIKTGHVEQPKVIHPRNHTVHVPPGVKTKLECTVFTGLEEDFFGDEVTVYWTVNDAFTIQYPQLQENLTLETREDNRIYGKSTLFISDVLPEFFGIPFECIILSPSGMDRGLVWLTQENQHLIQTWWIIAPVLAVAVLVGIVLCVFFKIDLILAYRHMCGKKKTKTYNAYVCYCHGNIPGSPVAENLALKILPEVLEQEHDLRLFIHGRDGASTGENVAEITDVLSQSRAVLLVLPGSQSANHEEQQSSIPLNTGQDKLSASLCRELYSVIAQSSVPVIVVESGENADYSLLPEYVQSIIQRDGVLRWSPAVQPSGRFWKHLRYHMT
ncbi:interleukin-1 receptor type 1-like [Salminus brasiliensis]|uniref:interleukin-1 receptor type 1-like n=1 Tax=Salminus brasiliensis TaxID=930266 RepID=UPI003B8309E9